ncbi:MAG: hypothetical protein AAGE52_11345 [Myxococcota bacterium]
MVSELQVLQAADGELGFIANVTVVGEAIYASGGTYHRSTWLTSKDGRSFQRRNTPPTSGLRGHCVRDSGDIVVVGEYGTVATTGDEGDTWTCHDTPAPACLYRVCEAFGAIWACGDGGVVLRSEDGEQWEQAYRGGGRLLGVFFCQRQLFFIGDQTLRYDGQTFSKVALSQSAPICAVSETPNGGLLAVGDRGQLHRSDDGTSWSALRVGTSADLEDIATLPGGLLVVGASGTLLFSDDGDSWAPLEGVEAREHFWSVAPCDDGVVLGGNRGLMMKLTIEMEEWEDFD